MAIVKCVDEKCVEIGQRLTKIRERANLNKKEFAKALNVTPAYITYLEAGEREAQDPILQAICHRFGVSFSWLKHGKGKMNADLRQKAIGLVWMVHDENLKKFIALAEEFIREQK